MTNFISKIFVLVSLVLLQAFCVVPIQADDVALKAKEVETDYVAKVKLSSVTVRMLILKHSFEQMAHDDAKMAIQAVNVAASKGLSIKDIGNFNINRNGQARLAWGEKMELDQLKSFVSQQMKVDAVSGDTLVIMTIGHGGTQGQLASLGQRREVMEAFAKAAEENEQETIWWQLSCYAAADLPAINTLSAAQQDLFSVVTSSDARTPSPAYVEGKVMERFFVALAQDEGSLDTDKDGVITAKEMGDFLATGGRRRWLYAKNDDEIVFGLNLAWRIPVVDREDPSKTFPKNYIPLPRKK